MSRDTAEPPPNPAAELLRTWEWAHLGYPLFVLAQPWFTPHPAPWEWPLAFAVCAITPVLWGKALHANGSPRRTWSAIVPMAVVGTLVTPVNAGASVLFVCAAAAGCPGCASGSPRSAARCGATARPG
ncbi:hypothetical protein KCV87_32055 [Actinosynnema pretiosum subsp. pretiosum]|uniref:Uncharacterized protein n=1 Tax=Actinosynnema pretiosum subsp. pretiosum TaxID=103721 RepID=A0AA45L5H6_9PSEU|nr:hypothetical protein APASM_4726 [Actinosynnema pretiosum subsp. pretiosum]QUF03939.1 hypothetical protein KCV87_32055 [Actinosynnema pretiosum subsp. pretiosum]